jgi:hypothetical protein
MSDWEIGEVVIVSGRSYVAPWLEKVTRVTKTQVILESGKRYNRKTLLKVGGDVWSLSRIQKATLQQIEKIEIESKIRSIRYRLKQEEWDYPIERLNQIIDIIAVKGVKQ